MQQIKNQAQEDADAEEKRVTELLDKKPSTEQWSQRVWISVFIQQRPMANVAGFTPTDECVNTKSLGTSHGTPRCTIYQ